MIITAFSTPGLRWKCLAVDFVQKRALVITMGIVEKRCYHESFADVTWEECTLRQWLNTEYFQSLPPEIRQRALEVTNETPTRYGTAGGSDTRDKVFLLSIDEAENCFRSRTERAARYQGRRAEWWLRSPGHFRNSAMFVYSAGDVSDQGFYVHVPFGVRPALWLSLNDEWGANLPQLLKSLIKSDISAP